jgi:hypothetical protein
MDPAFDAARAASFDARYSKYPIRADGAGIYPLFGKKFVLLRNILNYLSYSRRSFHDTTVVTATLRPLKLAELGVAQLRDRGGKMKGLTMVGIILLVIGLLAFVVPIPHKEDHSVKIGDSKIGVQTEHNDRLPPMVAGVLVLAGVVSLAAGARKSA